MKQIQEIYDLLYSPVITPLNLLENAKLENYDYVKYYKGKNGLVAEMKCMVNDIETLFHYHFDSKDWLREVFMQIEGKEQQVVYNRDLEIKNKIEEFNFNMTKSTKHKAC